MTAATTAPRVYNPISGFSCVAPAYASDLDVLSSHMPAVIDDAKSIVAGVSDAQFNWKPSPGRWSVAQCLKHLVLTGIYAANGQEAAVALLRERGLRDVQLLRGAREVPVPRDRGEVLELAEVHRGGRAA